jgi:hypothetical protein
MYIYYVLGFTEYTLLCSYDCGSLYDTITLRFKPPIQCPSLFLVAKTMARDHFEELDLQIPALLGDTDGGCLPPEALRRSLLLPSVCLYIYILMSSNIPPFVFTISHPSLRTSLHHQAHPPNSTRPSLSPAASADPDSPSTQSCKSS